MPRGALSGYAHRPLGIFLLHGTDDTGAMRARMQEGIEGGMKGDLPRNRRYPRMTSACGASRRILIRKKGRRAGESGPLSWRKDRVSASGNHLLVRTSCFPMMRRPLVKRIPCRHATRRVGTRRVWTSAIRGQVIHRSEIPESEIALDFPPFPLPFMKSEEEEAFLLRADDLRRFQARFPWIRPASRPG